MAGNKNLHSAKSQKNDEFYTQLSDIENELVHYKEHFKGKVIYCNCDDPYESNFFKYFAMNLNYLGLKKLIATCYFNSTVSGNEIDLFHQDEEIKKGYKIVVDSLQDYNKDGVEDLLDIEYYLKYINKPEELEGDGDFRSDECIELLKESDIVVTNPPFSLFREYVAQLMEYDKKFLIIGSINAITYKEIFPLIKDNKMWLGYGFRGGNAYFKIVNIHDYADGVYDSDTGLVKFRNCCWFTNLDIAKRHENLFLYEEYTPEKYPKYDNYDAINVDKVVEIPKDYFGVMGVPITFLDKYNPEQFEIVAFRKGEDGKDLVFTREREREFNHTFVSLYDGDCGDDKKRRRQDKWETYLRTNNNKEKKEPIDMFYPLIHQFGGNARVRINNKILYGRVFIKRK